MVVQKWFPQFWRAAESTENSRVVIVTGRRIKRAPEGILAAKGTVILEGGSPQALSAQNLPVRAPGRIFEDRSAPERPRWSEGPSAPTEGLAECFVPEYSDTERLVIEAGRATASKVVSRLVELLDEACPDLGAQRFSDPLETTLGRWMSDRLAAIEGAYALAKELAGAEPLAIGWYDGRIAAPLLHKLEASSAEQEIILFDIRPPDPNAEAFDIAVARRLGGRATPIAAGPADRTWHVEFVRYVEHVRTLDLGLKQESAHVVAISAPDPSSNLLETGAALVDALAKEGVMALSVDRKGTAKEAFDRKLAPLLGSARAQGFQMTLAYLEESLGKDAAAVKLVARWRDSLTQDVLAQAAAIPARYGASATTLFHDLISRLTRVSVGRFVELDARVGRSAAERRIRSLALLRGRPPLMRMLCLAARARGVSTVDIYPTALSDWVGHVAPLAETVAVPDSRGVEMFAAHFRTPKNALVRVGSVRLDGVLASIADARTSNLRSKLGLAPVSSKIILFTPSFGRPLLYQNLLQDVIEGLAGRDDVQLVVKTHPKETAANVERLVEIIRTSGFGERCLVTSSTSFYELLAFASVLVTGFSTTAFEACVAGIPTIAFIGDLDQRLPLRHVMSEMPHFITDRAKISPTLGEMLDYGIALNAWLDRRNKFMSMNSELQDGRTIERLASLLAR